MFSLFISIIALAGVYFLAKAAGVDFAKAKSFALSLFKRD